MAATNDKTKAAPKGKRFRRTKAVGLRDWLPGMCGPMAMISLELISGTKHSVDEEYPDLVDRLKAARAEGAMVKLKLCGEGEIHLNPEFVVSVQPMSD